MKIRKFNEAKEAVDLEYVRNCFADLIDSGKAKVREAQDFNRVIQHINIELNRIDEPRLRTEGLLNNKLRDYMKGYIENAAIIEEVLLSLDRIADEYPNYEIQYEVLRQNIFIKIVA